MARKVQILEAETWEAAAERIAQREVVVWSWVAVRPKGRAPVLYALSVRSRSLLQGDPRQLDYGQIIIEQEILTGLDASERFLNGTVGTSSGDLAGLSFPTPPANQGTPTYWLGSGESWGFGPESLWPTYYFEYRVGGDVDQLTWQSGFDTPLSKPGLPPYSHGRDAVFALVFGTVPPWPNPQLYPQVAVRLTDERARLGSIKLSGSKIQVAVEEASPARGEGFLLQGTWRNSKEWSHKYEEIPVWRNERYDFDTGDNVSEFSIFLLDPDGFRVDSREWKPTVTPISPKEPPPRASDGLQSIPTPSATPGTRSDEAAAAMTASKAQDPRAVAVVYGRNAKVKNALFDFLRSLGLTPREWGQLMRDLGQGSPYIGEVIKAALERAQAIVVLFTGDDEAQLLKEFRGKSEPSYEVNLTPQPRQNVLFEAGMAIGYNEARTILVEFGDRRPFSDIYGRHVVKIDKGAGWRNDLAQRLIAAGCEVNQIGNDWLTAGKFPRERTTAEAKRKKRQLSLSTGLEIDDQAHCFRLRVRSNSATPARIRAELTSITDDRGNPLLTASQLPIELNWTHQPPDVRPELSRMDRVGQSVAVLCYDQNPVAAEAELYIYGMHVRPPIGRLWTALRDRTINLVIALTPEYSAAGRIEQRFSLRFNENAPLRFESVSAKG